jgi:hypothetical protein
VQQLTAKLGCTAAPDFPVVIDMTEIVFHGSLKKLNFMSNTPSIIINFTGTSAFRYI